jgi:hypothetical protein
MRNVMSLWAGLAVLALASHPSAQGIVREPARGERPVEVVEATRQPPVELRRATLQLSPIGPDSFVVRAVARQSGTGPRWDRLEVRLAFRLDDGVRTYGLDTRAEVAVALNQWIPVEQRPRPGTTMPSLLEWSARTPVAVTMERITTADSTELWANPDARDRFWERLWPASSRATLPGRTPRR